ncbi:MAG: family transcriptional regulator [Rhodospirillales bacterium]|nr:family transcriptional regulator [Rhodospirillales bacterium]
MTSGVRRSAWLHERSAGMSARPTLGSLLRGLRTRQRWTLKEMSVRTGIPVSTLSKIEHDVLTLTYDKLVDLSDRLDLRISELFAEPHETPDMPAVTARRSIGRTEDAVRVTTSNYDYFYLCPELRRKRMVPYQIDIRARSIAEFGELVRHDGEEFLHVLEGRVVVHTEFYDAIELDQGESLYIDSAMGHAYVLAAGCKRALALGLCSSAEPGLDEVLLNFYDEDAPTIPAATPPPRKPRRVDG